MTISLQFVKAALKSAALHGRFPPLATTVA